MFLFFFFFFFFFESLEALPEYDHVAVRIFKEKTVILNREANDKIKGIQLIGPTCLQEVLRGVNWLTQYNSEINCQKMIKG